MSLGKILYLPLHFIQHNSLGIHSCTSDLVLLFLSSVCGLQLDCSLITVGLCPVVSLIFQHSCIAMVLNLLNAVTLWDSSSFYGDPQPQNYFCCYCITVLLLLLRVIMKISVFSDGHRWSLWKCHSSPKGVVTQFENCWCIGFCVDLSANECNNQVV